MAEHAERIPARQPGRRDPGVEGSRQRHEALDRRAAGQEAADYGRLLAARPAGAQPIQRAAAPNRTGLPDRLKSGIEALSGVSLDAVKVHYNSAKPERLDALAYAQGRDIHLAPGQEKHLPHEAWHLVQQAQGRVKPTVQLKEGVPVNDDQGLEREADVMGAKALSIAGDSVVGLGAAGDSAARPDPATIQQRSSSPSHRAGQVVQRALVTDAEILGQKGTTFKWTGFRGARVEGASGTASETGRGTALTTGTNIATAVQWAAIDPDSGEGMGIDATVGPDHNLGSSPSAAGALKRVAAFKALSGASYISGHLMNEKMGGPGDEPRNLTAISGSANTLQSSNIEKHVRDPVNEAGAWMRYQVAIDYADDTALMQLTDQKLVNALKCQAKGLVVLPTTTVGVGQVKVRYASRLAASWYPLDEDGGMAAQAETTAIDIASPLTGAGAPTLQPQGKSGAATGKAAAKTTILAEELVLTTSDLLKHVVTNRAPLALRIQQLKENIQALEGAEEETQEAIKALAAEAERLGESVGADYKFIEVLAARNLSPPLLPPAPIDVSPFREAYLAGYKRGESTGAMFGQLYMAGYDEGHDRGWGDEEKAYRLADTPYVQGYDRGHREGLEYGDYRKGIKYVFNGISLLLNRYEWHLNNFSHLRGSTTVQLTGNSFAQPNGQKWYEVEIYAAADLDPEELGTTAWMKRRWLNKGF